MPDGALLSVLERSRRLGFLGPGPVEDHVRHAQGFLEALDGMTGLVVDLGSGGGVPGLVLVVERPDLSVVLLDAMAKRCAFLREAVTTLGADDRVEVVEGRAEEIGRGDLRGATDAVIARSFGPPAATAECAAPLLRVGGVLVVSEPPDASDRWPEDGLAMLGMAPRPRSDGDAVQVIDQVDVCSDRYARRIGVPAKRPLF